MKNKHGKQKVLLIALLVSLFGVMTTACGTTDKDDNKRTEATSDNGINNRKDTNGDGILDDIGDDVKNGAEDIGNDVKKGAEDLGNDVSRGVNDLNDNTNR